MAEKITLEFGRHHAKKVIWIRFAYNKELIKRLKAKFSSVRWSRSHEAWYLLDTAINRKALGLEEVAVYDKLAHRIYEANRPALQRYIETLQLKAYSKSTIHTYTNEFCALLTALGRHKVDELTPQKLRSYFLYCHQTLKLSENLVHSRVNAIKFYFEQVLHREKMFAEIPRPKKPSTLPKVLSTADITKLFKVTENKKHLLMLQLSYGMGLRVSEVVNIKLSDISTSNMRVLVQAGKGKKDRYVNLPESILPLLKAYYLAYQPKKYLFEGLLGGQYAVRSVQAVFKNAMNKARVNKPVGIHSLRHSYATHLMEYGTDVAFIQKLLGHNNIKTTLLYTHIADTNVSKVKSPLDKL